MVGLQQKQRRTAVLFALGAVLSVLVFFAVYGRAPLDVANDAFCRGGYIERTSSSTMPGGCSTAKTRWVFPFA